MVILLWWKAGSRPVVVSGNVGCISCISCTSQIWTKTNSAHLNKIPHSNWNQFCRMGTNFSSTAVYMSNAFSKTSFLFVLISLVTIKEWDTVAFDNFIIVVFFFSKCLVHNMLPYHYFTWGLDFVAFARFNPNQYDWETICTYSHEW